MTSSDARPPHRPHQAASGAAWTGTGDPFDPRFMSVATVDVESDFIPAMVAGLSITPMEGLAIGHVFSASGSHLATVAQEVLLRVRRDG